MTEGTKTRRLSKVAKEFNIGLTTIVDFLNKKGITVANNPNAKIPQEAYELLFQEFQSEKNLREETRKAGLSIFKRESVSMDKEEGEGQQQEDEQQEEEAGDALYIKGTQASAPKEVPGKEASDEEAPADKEPVEEKDPKVTGEADQETPAEKPEAGEKEQPEEAGEQEKAAEQPVAGEAKDAVEADKDKDASAEEEKDDADAGLKVVGKIELEEEKPKKAKKVKAKKAKKAKKKEDAAEEQDKVVDEKGSSPGIKILMPGKGLRISRTSRPKRNPARMMFLPERPKPMNRKRQLRRLPKLNRKKKLQTRMLPQHIIRPNSKNLKDLRFLARWICPTRKRHPKSP